MRLTSGICWLWMAWTVLLCESAATELGERPPNIVVFLVDDLGARDVGCFGSSFYETPRIDRLAAEGLRFTNAYSACPVCSPTRASMMTGRYPQRTGITDYINYRGSNQPVQWNRKTQLLPAPNSDHLALEERTIAEVLRKVGYATFFAGKWHLGRDGYLPSNQGFEIATEGKRGPRQPLVLADKACDFIADHTEQPFLAYISFNSVHIPLYAPPKTVAKYEAKAERLPETEQEWDREGDSKVRLVQSHPVYAAMVETMDKAVGIVLDQLDELGLAEDTLVIFTSDNGGLSTAEGRPTSNLPLRGGKGWLYEGGIRVPTIIRWPGVTSAGETRTEPIISNDYYPTIVEASGQSPQNGAPIDGTSLMPLLRGEDIESRPLYWHYPHYGNQGGMPGSAVRRGRWKLVEWHEDESTELYDLQADPGETQNLVESHPKVVERLQGLLTDWRQQVGAQMPTINPNYEPSL